jgi:hypothetical protein
MLAVMHQTPLIAALAPVFPFDPAIEKPMAHQHLVLAYCFCWGIQLAYLGYIVVKQRASRKSEHE